MSWFARYKDHQESTNKRCARADGRFGVSFLENKYFRKGEPDEREKEVRGDGGVLWSGYRKGYGRVVVKPKNKTRKGGML